MVMFFFMAQGRIWWCKGMASTSSRVMAKADTAKKNQALLHLAELIRKNATHLKAVNAQDVKRAQDKGQDAAFIDRLTLTDKTIAKIGRAHV